MITFFSFTFTPFCLISEIKGFCNGIEICFLRFEVISVFADAALICQQLHTILLDNKPEIKYKRGISKYGVISSFHFLKVRGDNDSQVSAKPLTYPTVDMVTNAHQNPSNAPR